MTETPTAQVARVRVEARAEGSAVARLEGRWMLDAELPAARDLLAEAPPGLTELALDGDAITSWDSGLLTYLVNVIRIGEERGIETDRAGLPSGVQKLLALAFAVPEKEGTGRGGAKDSLLKRVGDAALRGRDEAVAMVTFVGESGVAFGRLFRGRARFRRSDLGLALQECGAEALGIVTLISFLIGLILAFIGAMQLRIFGAEIFVANLVAVGMAREMAPMMTGIVMAGRTGAAYAAQLGTMTVNEEIDSLRTLGISPMEFLVLPRMLALMVMMPLLTVYANALGILGGFAVAVGVLDLSPALYWSQTVGSVTLMDFGVGLVKAVAIGVLVAVAGCMRGMQCGRSASAVGLATTSAVVSAIVMIIVSEALFSVMFEILGI